MGMESMFQKYEENLIIQNIIIIFAKNYDYGMVR